MIQNNLNEVLKALDGALEGFLHELGGELKSQVQRNTRVDTGNTKQAWDYIVQNNEVTIGNPLENAIWEEFGTGEYALEGKGRKDVPWTYKGKDGKFYQTRGKRPSRALSKTLNFMEPKLDKQIAEYFRRRLS